MKVSLNLIKQLINFELPPVDELVSRVNQQLGGVEEVIDLKAKYGGARIVRVVECEKHPNADRLSVAKIDDGGVADVPRDDNGYVQVVCGAPNVHADMWAIWLPPKSTVPASFDDAEPFVLDARPLRGILSQGMLAAADELAIGTDHEGIIEINECDIPAGVTLQAARVLLKFLVWMITCWKLRIRCLRTGRIVLGNSVWHAKLLAFFISSLIVLTGIMLFKNSQIAMA